MDTISKTVDDFIAALARVSTPAEITATIRLRIERLGFECFAYWLVWPPKGPRVPFIFHNYPADWAAYYKDRNYGAHDLVIRYASVQSCPYRWQDVLKAYKPTARQKNVIHGGAEAGLRAGASVPIFGPGKAQAVFSVANDQSEDQFARLFAEARHALHLIASYTHERVLALELYAKEQKSIHLSSRELEIITFAAEGRTRLEIASRLKVSDETVKKHLENSRLKLNASNTTHATTIALLNRLILPYQ
jgi:DNA-binding CsgD family transcriptional regulator